MKIIKFNDKRYDEFKEALNNVLKKTEHQNNVNIITAVHRAGSDELTQKFINELEKIYSSPVEQQTISNHFSVKESREADI